MYIKNVEADGSNSKFDFDLIPSVNYAITLSQSGDLRGARSIFDVVIDILPVYPEGVGAEDRASLYLESATAEFDNPSEVRKRSVRTLYDSIYTYSVLTFLFMSRTQRLS